MSLHIFCQFLLRRDITKYILHFHISAFSTFAFPCFRIFNFCISMFPHFQLLHFPVSAFSYFRIFMFLHFHIFVFSYFHVFIFCHCCNFHTTDFLRNSSIVIVYIGTGCTLFRQYTTATVYYSDSILQRQTVYYSDIVPQYCNFDREIVLSNLQATRTNRPWAVGQNYFASWHPCGKYLICGLFERNYRYITTKKVPKQKNLPIAEKMGVQ